jgi:hypothetical protein
LTAKGVGRFEMQLQMQGGVAAAVVMHLEGLFDPFICISALHACTKAEIYEMRNLF